MSRNVRRADWECKHCDIARTCVWNASIPCLKCNEDMTLVGARLTAERREEIRRAVEDAFAWGVDEIVLTPGEVSELLGPPRADGDIG